MYVGVVHPSPGSSGCSSAIRTDLTSHTEPVNCNDYDRSALEHGIVAEVINSIDRKGITLGLVMSEEPRAQG